MVLRGAVLRRHLHVLGHRKRPPSFFFLFFNRIRDFSHKIPVPLRHAAAAYPAADRLRGVHPLPDRHLAIRGLHAGCAFLVLQRRDAGRVQRG